MKMLPEVDPHGVAHRPPGRHSTPWRWSPPACCPPSSAWPGPLYFAGALVLGLVYLTPRPGSGPSVSDATARRLLRTSFVYLPAVLLLLVLNPMPA